MKYEDNEWLQKHFQNVEPLWAYDYYHEGNQQKTRTFKSGCIYLIYVSNIQTSLSHWYGIDRKKYGSSHHIITAVVCLDAEPHIALVVHRCCVRELMCLEMHRCCRLAGTVLKLAHDLSIYRAPVKKWTPIIRVCIQYDKFWTWT